MAKPAPAKLMRVLFNPNRCSGLVSTKMVVEICRKLPHTTAKSVTMAVGLMVTVLLRNNPRGDAKLKMSRSIHFDLLSHITIINAIASGILCNTIPSSSEYDSCLS